MTVEIYKEYATTDITLAAVLIENQNQLDRIQLQGNKGIFHFLDVEKQLLLDFDTRKIMVEPIAFHTAVKNLTTAVKRQTRG
jgi:hypothetical protein